MQRCRSCGAGRVRDLGACPPFPNPEDAQLPSGHLLHCPVCLLAFREPAPTPAELLAMYRAGDVRPVSSDYEEKAGWRAARAVLTARLAERVDVSILDVGCHSGDFLSGLPDGWRRFGIEAEGLPAAIARADHDVELIAERIEAVPEAWHGMFDAVTMFDVLEHLLDPREGLRSAARLLKPGGLLVFSTADHDAWTWRWLGNGHWYLQTPQHLSVISRRYLRRLAASNQWTIHALRAIPARHAPVRERVWQTAKLLYWGARNRRGVWRLFRRFMQSLPGCEMLRHMNSVPWCVSLRDHFIATVETRVCEPDPLTRDDRKSP